MLPSPSLRRSPLLMEKLTPLIALSAGLPCAAHAADSYRFDLPAQTLRASLDAYSRVTGIEVRISGGGLEWIRVKPVRGDLTPTAALTELLSSAGLNYSFSGE